MKSVALAILMISLSASAQQLPGSFSGSVKFTEEKSGPITTEGATGTAELQSGITARDVARWVLCPPDSECDKNWAIAYDALRGVAVQPPGTTTKLVNAVTGYAVSQEPIHGYAFPTSGALVGFGVSDADGASVWGMNTILTDCRGQYPCGGKDRKLFNEFTFNIQNTSTGLTALQLDGTSAAQPAWANGIGCDSLGPKVKWTTCLVSGEGVTDTFLVAGARGKKAPNVGGQNMTFHYYDGNAVTRSVTYSAQPGGELWFANDEKGKVGQTPVTFRGVGPAGLGVVLGVQPVSALPGCSSWNEGLLMGVNDAASQTFNAQLKGGGKLHVMAYCNGSMWTVH